MCAVATPQHKKVLSPRAGNGNKECVLLLNQLLTRPVIAILPPEILILILIDTLYIAGIQVFQNEDKSCPERHGGANQTSLYIDSSEPSPGGGGMWKPDNTIRNCHHIPTLDIV